MKKISINEYLDENCICDPDKNDYTSVCGFQCNALWHWSDEIRRMKLLIALGYRYNPPELPIKKHL